MTNVVKALGCVEDLQLGLDTEDQTGNDVAMSLHRVDIHVAVTSVALLQALDVAKFPTARVYTTGVAYIDYRFDAFATEGIAPTTGTGFWVVMVNSGVASSDGTTGGLNSAGAGSQFVAVTIQGVTYRMLHDGVIA